jgi:hypothetical protein
VNLLKKIGFINIDITKNTPCINVVHGLITLFTKNPHDEYIYICKNHVFLF